MPATSERWQHFRAGSTGELLVAAKLVELGFDVFWAANQNTADFDIIAHYRGKLNRIQIKTKSLPRTNSLGQDVRCDGDHGRRNYDFLICHLLHHGATYVLPAEAAVKKHLTFYPDGLTTRTVNSYEEYRDAWHLLK